MASAEPRSEESVAELRRWASSGAMWLTGPPGGPPRVAPGSPAGLVRRALDRVLRAGMARSGAAPALPGVEILGERAALGGLRRRWPWSCGGAFRLLPAADGFFGVSMARAGDIDLVRALVGSRTVRDGEEWDAVSAWTAGQRVADAVGRGQLLGLACASLPTVGNEPIGSGAGMPPGRGAVLVRDGAPRAALRSRPLVVNLTALWAGPLCANLLGLTGAEIVTVESTRRPDGARTGSPALFDLLHRGHRMLTLDFHRPADLARLRELMAGADLVLEASRPRALAQLGIDAEEVVAAGTSWLSITARGRASNTVGFGDDVAADGGLVLWDNGIPAVCGDAIGDPLSGVVAAAAASEALLRPRAQLIDVSMVDVCREAAVGGAAAHQVVRQHDGWWVVADDKRFPVLAPRVRRSPPSDGRRR